MDRLTTATSRELTENFLTSSRAVTSGARQMPVTYSGVPPVTETVEVMSRPMPMTYAAAPMTYAAAPQAVEFINAPMTYASAPQAVEVIEQRVPVTYAAAPVRPIEVRQAQPVVEIVRDMTEVLALRSQLEEKAILVVEYQRRNNELQAQKAQYERLLAEAEGQMSQLKTERVTLLNVIQDNQAKIMQLQAEIAELLSRNEDLVAVNAEQAQRIVALDSLVVDLELKNANQQTEIDALRKCNRELEQLAEQQAAKIAELERAVADLQSRSSAAPPAMSDEERIDNRIKQYFQDHTDFQVPTTKERPGLYMFAKPINKKVSMKVDNEEVLARAGGGWEEVWAWLDSERLKFLESQKPAAGTLSFTIRWQLPRESDPRDDRTQDVTFTQVPMGFELKQDSEPATVDMVARGGHAESLGVRPGWQAVAVEGQTVEGWTYSEVTKFILSKARAVNPSAGMTTKRRSQSSISNGGSRQSR